MPDACNRISVLFVVVKVKDCALPTDPTVAIVGPAALCVSSAYGRSVLVAAALKVLKISTFHIPGSRKSGRRVHEELLEVCFLTLRLPLLFVCIFAIQENAEQCEDFKRLFRPV